LSPPLPSSFASVNTGKPRFTWKMAVKTKRESAFNEWVKNCMDYEIKGSIPETDIKELGRSSQRQI